MKGTRTDSNNVLDLFLVQLAGKYTKYHPPQVLFNEGDPGKTMLLILNGRVQIVKKQDGSREPVVIATRGEGEFIGEMALVEESPRSASAIAETECEVLEFSKDHFEKIIKSHPSFATRVLKSLSTKLRESDISRINDLEENNRLLNDANRRLLDLNSFLDSIIDQSPAAVLIVNHDGKLHRLNKAASRMFGLPQEVADYHVDKLFIDFKFDEAKSKMKESWQGEMIGRRGREEFPIYLNLSLISAYSKGKLYLLAGQDMTDINLFAKAKTNYEKFDGAQQVAVELAYEVSNAIKDLLEKIRLLVDCLPSEQRSQSEQLIETVDNTSRGILKFTENYMNYRGTKCDFKFVDIRMMLWTIIRFCRSQPWFSNIKIRFRAEPDFPKSVLVRDVQIQNVFMNLFINAAEAFSELPEEAERILLIELSRQDESAVVQISDNGPGIDEENVAKLFNGPFSTHRNRLGQGLYSAAKIIEGHSGKISMESEKGKGTKFKIALPLRTIKKDA